MIDAKRTAAGILGSTNTMSGSLKGVVGYVIDGTCRDSAECILQKTPAFCTVRSPAHPMGRIGPVSNGEPIVLPVLDAFRDMRVATGSVT